MRRSHNCLLEEVRPRRIWPLVVTALVVGAYFHSMLFLDKVPNISDIRTYYYPAWTYFSHAFKSGGPPLWCSGIYCGFPLFADSEMGVFYPVNLLFFQLPATAGFNYSIIFHYLLGGFFAFAYCRLIRLSRPASLFVAIPFVLGGFFLSHMVHPNAVATAAWMPLFLYCLERALAEKRLSFYALAGGVLGVQSLSGFLMLPLVEMVLALFYVIFHPSHRGEGRGSSVLRALGGLALAAGLGAGVGMIQNLPSYNLVQNSYRAGGLSEQVSNIGSLPPAQLAGIVLPRLFGAGLAQGDYLGAWTFEETYTYIGIMPLLFAPAALFRPRKWHAVFFLFAGVVSVLLSLGDRGRHSCSTARRALARRRPPDSWSPLAGGMPRTSPAASWPGCVRSTRDWRPTDACGWDAWGRAVGRGARRVAVGRSGVGRLGSRRRGSRRRPRWRCWSWTAR